MTTATTGTGGAPLVRPAPGTDPPGHLTTGWEPHRPAGDSLERRFVLAFAESLAGPVSAMGGAVTQRATHLACDLGRPSGLLNAIVLTQPLPHAGWESVLADAMADLLPDGRGTVDLWNPWPSPDLTGLGWELVGHPPVLVRLDGEPEPPPPAWLRIERVTSAATLADWEHVAVAGYPFPECAAGGMVTPALLSHPAWHGWVGYAGDDPVAIGTSYLAHGVNVFALGVTLADHRGRGAWHALARRRLATFPTLPAMSLFSDFSRGPAEGLGFVTLRRWTVWQLARA